MKNFIIKSVILICCLVAISPVVSIAQSHTHADRFRQFVTKNYNLPQELKYNCEWMYAIVRLKGNSSNKVVSYEVLNDALAGMKNFDFLIGYRFPKSIAINKHPVVFYFSIDNKEICKPKAGDKIYYSPNEVVGITVMYLQRILKDDPKTIIIPGLMLESFYEQQIKNSN